MHGTVLFQSLAFTPDVNDMKDVLEMHNLVVDKSFRFVYLSEGVSLSFLLSVVHLRIMEYLFSVNTAYIQLNYLLAYQFEFSNSHATHTS